MSTLNGHGGLDDTIRSCYQVLRALDSSMPDYHRARTTMARAVAVKRLIISAAEHALIAELCAHKAAEIMT